MYYQEQDHQVVEKQIKKEEGIMALSAIPGLLLLVAGFLVRNRIMAMCGLFLFLAVLIFLYGMRLGPLLHYRKFLEEISEGLSHDTRGVLVRIGEDPVFENGVDFKEIILNIYKDQAEDGERRFLLDQQKKMPDFPMGSLVTLKSHGVYVLDISPLKLDGEQ